MVKEKTTDKLLYDFGLLKELNNYGKNIKQKLLVNPELKEIVINIKQSLISNEQYGFDKFSSIDYIRLCLKIMSAAIKNL